MIDAQYLSDLLGELTGGPDLTPPFEIQALPGEVDRNYRLDDSAGHRVLLKLTVPGGFGVGPILEHLSSRNLTLDTPKVLAVHTVDTPEGPREFRIHSWVPGQPVDGLNPRTPTLRRSWGRACARLSAALAPLDLPAARRSYKWDPLRVAQASPLVRYLTAAEREVVDPVFRRLLERDFSHLPRQLNYNDAHELNLLSTDGREVSGVIDFGDAVFTARACEPAIACAYAAMGARDPLGAMRDVVEGYTSIQPLEEAELEVLFDLVCARLLLTVTAAAENAHLHPHNPYLSVSADPAWELLRQLAQVHPRLAEATFRAGAGLPPHPAAAAYHRWAESAPPLHAVMNLPSRILPMDLGVGSRVLGLNRNFEDLSRFVVRVRRHLEDHGADLATGGYGETRPVYTTDDFCGEGNRGPRWRSVHLGLDFWTREPGGTVYAPLAGTVQHSGFDPTEGGYGTTILLRHDPVPLLTFYTLYGHLSADSLEGMGAGTRVQGGQPIARLGGREENGGWPPHLHFQVSLDLLGQDADYPGVAYPDTRDVWLGICPDPRTLLPSPVPAEVDRPQPVEALLTRRQHALGYGLSVSYAEPLQILRGARQYLYDSTGRRYLDTVNNVAHVGHEHPLVAEAIQQQAAVLNTNSRYLHDGVLHLAEALVALLPPALSVVHFVNSGTEANELALRMAEAVTGNRRVAAFEMGYHGNSSRTIEVSSYKFDRRGGRGRPADTLLLPLPDRLRGANVLPPADLGPGPVSFIGESIISCGGQVVLPEGYLAEVYRLVRASGGVTIADEVQTGLGRVGDHWWAFEAHGVVPDIVTVGKPFGNGHPLAAVVCTEGVARAFANGMEYFNTFGGNPVSAAAGLSVLKVLREEGLKEQAADTGRYLTDLLRELQQERDLIVDVRGAGLFLGFELAGKALAPASPPAAYLKNRMRELGILMSTDGPHENVLKIKPPLCFGRRDADHLVDYLRRVFAEDAMRWD